LFIFTTTLKTQKPQTPKTAIKKEAVERELNLTLLPLRTVVPKGVRNDSEKTLI